MYHIQEFNGYGWLIVLDPLVPKNMFSRPEDAGQALAKLVQAYPEKQFRTALAKTETEILAHYRRR